MSKAFNSIKDPRLGLLGILPIGKFKNCRVCDIIEDDWEYLKWMHANTSVKFQQVVLDKITKKWKTASNVEHHANEVAPYLYSGPWFSDMEDDVPY